MGRQRARFLGAKKRGGYTKQTIRILEYLDGAANAHMDMPADTPVLVNPRIYPVPLLEFDPNQNPPAYLTHISKHLNGVVQSPGANSNQRALATRISAALNNVNAWLQQVHRDAVQLFQMPPDQLLSNDGLLLLDDMETNALYAFIGQLDPATNQIRDGVVQISYSIQQLATFDVTLYKP